MRSDRTPPPLRRRIVAVSLASSALLFLLAGGITAALLRSFQAEDARTMLEDVSADLAAAYRDFRGDIAQMREYAGDVVDAYGTDDIALLLSAADGSALLRAGAADGIPAAGEVGHPAEIPGGRRAMRMKETALYDGARLVIGLDETIEKRRFARLLGAMSVAFLVALFVGGFSADWLARRFVRSLGGVSAAAARIRAGEWSARVEPTRESLEIARLEDAFNTMCDRLQRLVGNLLDNAIKFTPDGGSVSLALDRSGGNVVLRVSDTGCGIAPGDLPHVFRRFWRADASRSLPGNGLGLALVKAIVSSYGGGVRCESEPGRGTRFTVELPVPDAAPQTERTAHNGNHHHDRITHDTEIEQRRARQAPPRPHRDARPA